jgi:alpha-methylacyl-CoA racemase
VVDLSRLLPGPLAAHLLAGLGCRVVKVEEPALGDPVRQAPPRRAGTGALAALLLSGVESVALDLKQPAGREVLERLLERADVLLESFRPGTLERLGFPPGELRSRHPRLIVCSLSGWGQSGPYASKAGHDLTYQAVAGGLAPTAPPAMPAAPLADLTGSWSAVASILAAVIARERTGEGTHIDASLFDAAVHSNLVSWASAAGGERKVGESLALTGALPCYNLYRTADGHLLALAALEPHFWRRFCDAAGRRGLIRLQYSTKPRARRRVASVIRRRTRAEWLELLARVDVPAEAVLSAAEARAHPQTRERGVLAEAPDRLPRLAFPACFDGERPRSGDSVPALGEHTEAVLAELGMEDARKRPGIGRRFSLRRILSRWLVP